MDVQAHIRHLCNQIVEKFHPQKVILFGSYADGRPNYDSDIDLMVVMPYLGSELDKMAEVRLQLDSTIPVDVLVKTPNQIKNRIALGDFFILDIVKNGKLLYERGDIGLDR